MNHQAISTHLIGKFTYHHNIEYLVFQSPIKQEILNKYQQEGSRLNSRSDHYFQLQMTRSQIAEVTTMKNKELPIN